MTDETTLEDILSGKAQEAADISDEMDAEDEVTTEVKGETEEVEADAEADKDDAPPASPAKPPEGFVPQAALLDERSKRQELQDRLAALERQFNQPKEPEKESKPIDFLDDPDGWAKQLQDKFSQELSRVEYNASAKLLNVLEAAARSRYEDYDTAAQAFAQVAQGNTALQQEAASSPDPAEYVYQAGKRLLKLNEANGDLDTLIQRERERAVAEYMEKNPTPTQKAASVPTSLSTVTGATGAQKEVGPPPLSSLFNSY